MNLISVVMSTYREPPEYMEAAINSILHQTYRDLECLVVLDDPENTAAAELVTRMGQNDARLRVIRNEKNLGLTASLNRAIGLACGDYIARMDADDLSYPTRLEAELQYMQEHDLDLVGSLTRFIDGEGKPAGGGNREHCSPEQIVRRLTMSACIPHPTWLVKRDVYRELNNYRDVPRCEDYDFLLRAVRKGYRLGLCDSVQLDYRINAAGISQSGLLEQRLAGRYLVRNFHRIESVSRQEIARELERKLTEKAARRYAKADALFRQAAQQKKTAPIRSVMLLVQSVCTSKYYRKKIANIVKLRLKP